MTSKYYGVSYYVRRVGASSKMREGAATPWKAHIKRNDIPMNIGSFKTEREAAIAVDKKLIEIGEEPRNILKKQSA